MTLLHGACYMFSQGLHHIQQPLLARTVSDVRDRSDATVPMCCAGRASWSMTRLCSVGAWLMSMFATAVTSQQSS